MNAAIAPLDELRALPPPLQRAVLARIAEQHGAAAVAALRWQIEAHRRPAQRIPALEALPTVLVITGEYGSGKTQLASWITLRAILDWKVDRPRVIASIPANVDDTVVNGPSGLLAWLPPWISREWYPTLGHAGKLRIDGRDVSCLSAAAGAGPIGAGCGFVFFDDYAKCVTALGESKAEEALAAALKSLREWPGKMVLPTTPEGAELVRSLAQTEGIRGVEVLDLGRTEDNAGNLTRGYVRDIAPNLRALDMWQKSGGGAFAGVQWAKLRVDAAPPLVEIVVAIDPAKSSRSKSCEVGIVGVGRDAEDRIYGLADRSEVLSSDDWPNVAHELLEHLRAEHPRARARFVAENNAGGDAPAALLRFAEKLRRKNRGEPGVSVIEVVERTARRNDGKARRASEIVGVYKGGQGRMVRGLGILEGQLSKLVDEGTGTDRADAFVWGARDLAGLGESDAPDRSAQTQHAARAALDANKRFRPPAIPGGLV